MIEWISEEDARRDGGDERRVLIEQTASQYPEFGRFLERELANGDGALHFRGSSGNVYRLSRVDQGDPSDSQAGLRSVAIDVLEKDGAPVDDAIVDEDLWPFMEWLITGVGGEWKVDALRQTGSIYRVPSAPQHSVKAPSPLKQIARPERTQQETNGEEGGSDPFDYSYEPWKPPAVEPEDRFFETDDGVRLHYVQWPSEENAPVVLMVHGRRAHARWFDPVTEGLAPRYCCLSLDLRGHGDSGNRGATDLNRYAKDVGQWMRLFAGRRRALLAHSMAGRVAILAQEHHRVNPDLLIMADTPLARRPHHFKPEPPFVSKAYPTKEAALRRFRLMPPGTSANPELLLYIAEQAIRENTDGTWSWKFSDEGTSRPVGLEMPDWSDLGIENFTCPALVIYGEHSVLVDAEDALATARRLPHGKAVAVKGAYHHLMLDRPKAFNDEVLRFFQANSF